MKMTYKHYVHVAYEESDDGLIEVTCASCNSDIWTDDMVTPCCRGMAEGSGHGGYDGMSIYCIPAKPIVDENGDSNDYCGWGGPLRDFEPLLLCGKCGGTPYA